MNTLAIRDQENFVHNQQTAAAAKPLNQGTKGLAPKTPGNNGFKSIVNAHKTIRAGKGGDENAAPAAKTAKALKTSFVTPTPQRERAPLGAKTTNIKAKAFQTPAPLTVGNGFKTQARTTSARKAKLKVHKPEVVQAETPLLLDDEEEPEIEYCPPKIKELPDYPDDPLDLAHLPPDAFRIHPFGGWSDSYGSKWDKDNENPISDAAIEEKFRQQDEEMERSIAEDALKLDLSPGPAHVELDRTAAMPGKHAINPATIQGPRQPRDPSTTLDAASAAAALSSRPTPRFAQPTAATSARKSAAPLPKPSSTTSPRITAAARNTLGYAAGRKASSLIKQSRQSQSKQMPIPVSARTEPATEGRLTPPWAAVYRSEHSDEEDGSLFGAKNGDLFAACDEYINGLVGPEFKLELADVL